MPRMKDVCFAYRKERMDKLVQETNEKFFAIIQGAHVMQQSEYKELCEKVDELSKAEKELLLSKLMRQEKLLRNFASKHNISIKELEKFVRTYLK